MLKNIDKIIKLSKIRINILHNEDDKGFYKGYKTYIEGIQDELKEAIDEIKEHNSIHLEDELGDIFWDYICLLHSLEENGYIDKEKVFKRCIKKFSERIGNDGKGGKNWEEVKSIQKEELKNEYIEKYKKRPCL